MSDIELNDQITVHKYDEVYFWLECNYEQSVGLRNHLSCYAPNHKFDQRFKAKVWDGKISFYDLRTKLLPIGLIDELQKFAFRNDYELIFDFDKEEFVDSISEQDIHEFYEKIYSQTDFYPRDYQHNAIKRALSHHRGIIQAATGAGKSLTIYSLIRYCMEVLEGDVILVVPNITLVNQMFSDFTDYGWETVGDEVCVLYTNAVYNENKRVLITTWQSVYKREPQFFERFGAIIVDECHSINSSSSSLRTILEKAKYAQYRIGLTATVPTFPADIRTLTGYLGPILSTVTTEELIDRKILSEVKIINCLLKYSAEDVKNCKKMTYPEEVRFVTEHPLRNNFLGFVLKNINSDENSIVLCDRIEHLKRIVGYLEENFPDRPVEVIRGSVSGKERERIRKSVEGQDGIIIVATYATMSTGVNIPKIHNIFLFSSYKSMFKIYQTIGRGLRKHESKKFLKVWDVVDDLRYKKRKTKNQKEPIGYNYLFDHFKERLTLYDKQNFKYINKSLDIYKLDK